MGLQDDLYYRMYKNKYGDFVADICTREIAEIVRHQAKAPAETLTQSLVMTAIEYWIADGRDDVPENIKIIAKESGDSFTFNMDGWMVPYNPKTYKAAIAKLREMGRYAKRENANV